MQTSLQILKIYLDTCCLCRLFDAQAQLRVRQETEAIRIILENFQTDYWLWIASETLMDEVNAIRDLTRHNDVLVILQDAHQVVSVGAAENSRGKYLETFGFKPYDALHLACAESGEADVFLTTDDQVLNAAKRQRTRLHLQVENPHTWLQRITTMDQNQLQEDEQERQRRKAAFRARLDRIFAFKDGKGNYTEERHQQPMPDIDTITKRIYAARAAREAAEKSSSQEE